MSRGKSTGWFSIWKMARPGSDLPHLSDDSLWREAQIARTPAFDAPFRIPARSADTSELEPYPIKEVADVSI